MGLQLLSAAGLYVLHLLSTTSSRMGDQGCAWSMAASEQHPLLGLGADMLLSCPREDRSSRSSAKHRSARWVTAASVCSLHSEEQSTAPARSPVLWHGSEGLCQGRNLGCLAKDNTHRGPKTERMPAAPSHSKTSRSRVPGGDLTPCGTAPRYQDEWNSLPPQALLMFTMVSENLWASKITWGSDTTDCIQTHTALAVLP